MDGCSVNYTILTEVVLMKLMKSKFLINLHWLSPMKSLYSEAHIKLMMQETPTFRTGEEPLKIQWNPM